MEHFQKNLSVILGVCCKSSSAVSRCQFCQKQKSLRHAFKKSEGEIAFSWETCILRNS